MQCIMRDRNHHQHSKMRYRPSSSSYELRDSLSSSQCLPHLTSHLTRLMKSNWHPTPHLKNSNCAAYPYVIRADPTRFGSHVHRRREIGSISQRPTFCYRQSRDPSQCIPHVPPHDPRRPPPTRPPALTAKTDKCAPMLPHPAKKEKPRPETCNQAWSVSEQHLLDRLLSQIPDGEKNRYERLFLSLTHA